MEKRCCWWRGTINYYLKFFADVLSIIHKPLQGSNFREALKLVSLRQPYIFCFVNIQGRHPIERKYF